MTARRILILGGTTEGTELARRLVAAGAGVTTSFAGRTSSPTAAAGATVVGGFGGASGLAGFLAEHRIEVLVDATHPFAARMRWNAAEAADLVDIPRIRVERGPWVAEPGDRWRSVPDLTAAAEVAGRFSRVFLTTGRQDLEPFALYTDVWFLVRSIEPVERMPLSQAHVLLARGPFTVPAEHDLMTEYRIEAVVTKNSGGRATAAKLTAARQLGLPVVMVARPPSPPGPLVHTVPNALAWLDRA